MAHWEEVVREGRGGEVRSFISPKLACTVDLVGWMVFVSLHTASVLLMS